MAIVAILLSRDQLINPKLSVGIFAQNGVYAYFAAAFVPIVFGMFVRNASTAAAVAGAVTAVVVHFIMYYGNVRIPFSVASGENPGVAAATAIVAAILVAGIASRLSPVQNTQHQ
jgi:sodium/pantothenate symporter